MKTRFPLKNFRAVTVHQLYDLFEKAFVKPVIEIKGKSEGAIIDGLYRIENEGGGYSFFAVVETFSGVVYTVELSQMKWYQAAW